MTFVGPPENVGMIGDDFGSSGGDLSSGRMAMGWPGRSCIVCGASVGISGGTVDGTTAAAAVGISGAVGIAGGRVSGTVGPAAVGRMLFGSSATRGAEYTNPLQARVGRRSRFTVRISAYRKSRPISATTIVIGRMYQ